MKRLFAALTLLFAPAAATAQETVDLGTLRNDEIQVVQRLLYPKEGRTEFSMGIGAIVFDPYMIAPKIQLTGGKHLTENLAVEGQLGVGYGIGNLTYRELGTAAYGIKPEVYRYLGSATAGVSWAPVYAKMNFMGRRVIHHDLYMPLVAGVTLERQAWAEKYFAPSPTLGIGIGTRVFQANGGALRIELRDDLMVQNRKQTGAWTFKQNVSLTVGYSRLSEAK